MGSRFGVPRAVLAALSAAFVLVSAVACGAEREPVAAADVAPSCLSVGEARSGLLEFKNAAGERLVAFTEGDGSAGVVLAHQSDADLCQWKPYADELAEKGYRALTLTMGANIDDDVLAAIDEIRRAGARQVFLVGASMGGTAVLTAAAQASPPVDGVASLSAPADYFGTDALAAAKTLTVPAFFLAAKSDGDFAADARAMHAAATRSPGRKLSIVAGSGHGIELLTGTVKADVEAFLAAHGVA